MTELDTVLRSWDALYSATGTAPRPPAQLCSTPPAVDVSGPTPTQPDLVPVQQQEEEHDEAHNDHDSSNNVAASNFSSALASIPEEDAGSPLPTPPQDMLSAVLASIPEEEATEDDSPDAFGVSSGRALQLDAALSPPRLDDKTAALLDKLDIIDPMSEHFVQRRLISIERLASLTGAPYAVEVAHLPKALLAEGGENTLKIAVHGARRELAVKIIDDLPLQARRNRLGSSVASSTWSTTSAESAAAYSDIYDDNDLQLASARNALREALRTTTHRWHDFLHTDMALNDKLATPESSGPSWKETAQWALWMLRKDIKVHNAEQSHIPVSWPSREEVGCCLRHAKGHLWRAIYPELAKMSKGEWRLYWMRVEQSFSLFFTNQGRRYWKEAAALDASASAIRSGKSVAEQGAAASRAVHVVTAILHQRVASDGNPSARSRPPTPALHDIEYAERKRMGLVDYVGTPESIRRFETDRSRHDMKQVNHGVASLNIAATRHPVHLHHFDETPKMTPGKEASDSARSERSTDGRFAVTFNDRKAIVSTWTCADLAKHVCGVLAKEGKLKAKPANLRMDREGRLTRILKDAKLAGEQIVEMTPKEAEAALRQWSRGQTWVEDVYGVIKDLLKAENPVTTAEPDKAQEPGVRRLVSQRERLKRGKGRNVRASAINAPATPTVVATAAQPNQSPPTSPEPEPPPSQTTSPDVEAIPDVSPTEAIPDVRPKEVAGVKVKPIMSSRRSAAERVPGSIASGDAARKKAVQNNIGRLDPISFREHLRFTGGKRVMDFLRAMDLDGSGSLHKKEFGKTVRTLGFLDATKDEIRKVWDWIDMNGDGSVPFVDLNRRLRTAPTEAKKAESTKNEQVQSSPVDPVAPPTVVATAVAPFVDLPVSASHVLAGETNDIDPQVPADIGSLPLALDQDDGHERNPLKPPVPTSPTKAKPKGAALRAKITTGAKRNTLDRGPLSFRSKARPPLPSSQR